MSAYIVSKQTIDDAVSIITSTDKDITGTRLWLLNVLAIKARYEGNADAMLGDVMDEIADYSYGEEGKYPPHAIQRLKSLDCLLYQMAEGDVPDHPLYKKAVAASDDLVKQLKVDYPKFADLYSDAQWGRY